MNEIREYWRILRARWYLPLLLAVLTVAASLLLARPAPPAYVASIRFTIGVPANPNVTGGDPILGAYQASEYVRDDFVEVLPSEMFANDVNARLTDPALHIGRGNLSGAVEKQRRIMSLHITWPTAEGARRIAEAAAQTLAAENAKYFAQLGAQGATVAILDGPDVSAVSPGLREQLDPLLRGLIAFAAGLVIIFVLDYLDDSVRDERDARGLGFNVVGEIPDRGMR